MFKAKRNIFRSELDEQIIQYRVGTRHRDLHLDDSTLFQALEQHKEGGSTTVCEGVIVGKRCIIFDQVVFTGEHIELLSRLFNSSPGNDIYFIDCEFRNTFIQEHNILPDLFFRRCTFCKSILFLQGRITSKLCFFKCHFRGKVAFENIRLSSIFNIQDSWFEANSLFSLKKTVIDHFCKFSIKNTQFYGKFEVKNTEIHSVVKFENISFFDQFQMEKLDLRDDNCVFKNFSFSHASSKDMILAQSAFAKTLQENRYTQVIDSLGLTTVKTLEDNGYTQVIDSLGVTTTNSSNSLDSNSMEKYEMALKSGFLKPEYAAYFLGKSVNYLAKKRAKDKEQITREALPFIGKGKDIQYPVDALLAFKAKDWVKLKELRKKYEMNEEEKED